jgi:hydroxymethylbilane synthase
MQAMKTQTIKIATRGSKLALWQAEFVRSLLKAKGYTSELIILKTKGDIVQDRFLHEIGGKGLFIKELENALVNGEADIAVHSLKDLPAKLSTPFALGAILKRHSPRDIFIFRPGFVKDELGLLGTFGSTSNLAALPACRFASSSLRRTSLLKAFAPQIKVEGLRGNVDTRIAKLNEGMWDGIILSEAAIDRLELYDLEYKALDPKWFVPCAGQGALAIECLEDHPVKVITHDLDCSATHFAVDVEREVLHLLGGDCTMPVGVYCEADEEGVETHALLLNYEGGLVRARVARAGDFKTIKSDEIAQDVFNSLMDHGGEKILADLKKGSPKLTPSS